MLPRRNPRWGKTNKTKGKSDEDKNTVGLVSPEKKTVAKGDGGFKVEDRELVGVTGFRTAQKETGNPG